MPSHAEQQFSPYSPKQLFDLVADIERYPEFLPWCRAVRVLERGENEMLGELMVCFKHICESYTSRIELDAPKDGHTGSIHVNMVKGPFEYLRNEWGFTPLPEGGTRIDFFVDFKFRSKMLDMMLGGFFGKAVEKMGQAFKERAEQLYGAQSS